MTLETDLEPKTKVHYHGFGVAALFEQADYLEEHLDEAHVLFSYDVASREEKKLVLDKPATIREAARLLRLKATHRWSQDVVLGTLTSCFLLLF